MTAPLVNRQWRVARLVEPGELLGPEHFVWQEAAVPEPADGEVLVRTLCLSTSPAQRGYISVNRNRQLLPDLAVGSVMRGRGIGVVVASRHPDFQPGELYDARSAGRTTPSSARAIRTPSSACAGSSTRCGR